MAKRERNYITKKELLKRYHAQRTALDAKIDQTLAEIQQLLGIDSINPIASIDPIAPINTIDTIKTIKKNPTHGKK